MLNDTAMRLIEDGVATGACKTIDRRVAVADLLAGTEELSRWADRNPRVALRSTAYTHDPAIVAGSSRLVAINSAIEVDLTGQVNAEVAAGRYVGAIGGAVDFLRGAARSAGGLSIVALPCTAKRRSRIVARLSGPKSTSRACPCPRGSSACSPSPTLPIVPSSTPRGHPAEQPTEPPSRRDT